MGADIVLVFKETRCSHLPSVSMAVQVVAQKRWINMYRTGQRSDIPRTHPSFRCTQLRSTVATSRETTQSEDA